MLNKKIAFLLVATCVTRIMVAQNTTLQVQGKFNPGHYVFMYEKKVSLSTIKGYESQAIVGIKRRYKWCDLEPEKGKYDFSSIRRDLEDCKKYGKQLVVFILDKTFYGGKGPMGKSVLPKYLQDLQTVAFNGLTPFRWTDRYIEAHNNLMIALGREFDSHPNFEGYSFQETALALSNEELTTLPKEYEYSHEKYAAAMIKYVINAQKAMPNSRIFWLMNYLGAAVVIPEYIPEAFVPYRIVMGGPDILPWRTTLNKSIYPLYDKFYGKLPLCCAMEPDSFHTNKFDLKNNHPHSHSDEGGYESMDSLFLFGRDRLHLNYIFWSYTNIDAPEYPGANSWDDALAVINKYPVF